MPVAKRVRSRVAAQKRHSVATAPGESVVALPEPSTMVRIVELRIEMLPHVEAPSAAQWQSFAASIAQVANRGYLAPTVRVDHDLRGARVKIGGWEADSAIRMVRLHAANSPSPPLWQSHNYEVSVIASAELPVPS
jgi:hypothetical protein